jgi:hypothetical protein
MEMSATIFGTSAVLPSLAYLPLKKWWLEVVVDLRERSGVAAGSWLNDTVVTSGCRRCAVLRETDPQATLWDALLPEQAKRLPAELTAVDGYLDDERFVAPWRALFSARLGRPSVPVETLLRLLYLALGTRPDDGRLRRLLARLEETTIHADRLLDQTRQRLAGNRVVGDRLESPAGAWPVG